jgi:hypothetical protein
MASPVLFHGTRWGWMVWYTPRPIYIRGSSCCDMSGPIQPATYVIHVAYIHGDTKVTCRSMYKMLPLYHVNFPPPVIIYSMYIKSKAWVFGCLLAGVASSNPAGEWMCISCEFYVLSGRGLCVGLITRPEESHRVWCVWVWSWSLDNEEALAHWGLLRNNCVH